METPSAVCSKKYDQVETSREKKTRPRKSQRVREEGYQSGAPGKFGRRCYGNSPVHHSTLSGGALVKIIQHYYLSDCSHGVWQNTWTSSDRPDPQNRPRFPVRVSHRGCVCQGRSRSLIAAQRSGPQLPVPWLCKK